MTSASDRSKRMKALFGGIDPASLEDQAPSPVVAEKRVSSGAVKSMHGAFSAIEQENEALRATLAQSERLLDLDPELVDASFVKDRMDIDADPEFQSLVESMRETGQQVPVLVRPHPEKTGRYQLAYGHRRWRAAKDLSVPLKALVRTLSDDALVIAQGKENTERKALSFIEQALFAQTLKDRGFDRQTIANALGRGEKKGLAYISMLTAITGALPRPLIDAIGPAPLSGRPRWENFVGLHAQTKERQALEALIASAVWQQQSSDQRLLAAIAALSQPAKTRPQSQKLINAEGLDCIAIQTNGTQVKISIDTRKTGGFADWLVENLPEMLENFQQEAKNDTQ